MKRHPDPNSQLLTKTVDVFGAAVLHISQCCFESSDRKDEIRCGANAMF